MTPEKEINKERVSSLLKDWGVEKDEEINEFCNELFGKQDEEDEKMKKVFGI